MNDDQEAVELVLDTFHAAASAADEDRYASTLSPGAVFLGTDPGERWAGESFREFFHHHFSQGRGWTYTPSTRSVAVAADRRTAWFDERLDSDLIGECRGTGVLQLHDGEWRIEQYSLSLPIPNGIVMDVVRTVRDVET